MKKLLLLLFALYFAPVFAQDEFHCGTDVVMKNFYTQHPEKKAQKEQQDAARVMQSPYSQSATYTIPIVFHILHMGGPENISDFQVIDAVRILNRDFAKQNPDLSEVIAPFQSLADSARIQFKLATKDPSGNCTNGIVHYYDTDTDWDDQSPTIYGYTWDPTRYLNVYIVKTITLSGGFSAAGYTYFPGSWSPGDPHDAIVVLNNYFGSIGTGNAFLSRVLTHEVGHWLDLYHVFGGTNSAGVDCSGDDFVADTPTTIGYLFCPDPNNPPSYQICTPGVSENFQNYMDYSYCVRMFTQGQVGRMQAALNNNIAGRDNLWTNANLVSTGVINPSGPCVPVADFSCDRNKTCVGVPVTFSDESWNSHPSSYSWSFPGGVPSTSTDSMPVVIYNTPGVYSVTHSSATSAGSSAPVTQTNIITVTTATATYTGAWSEGFETASLPNNDWSVTNSSGGTNWEQSFDAAYTGSYSARLPNVNHTRLAVTSMTSPSVNLSTLSAPVLTFKLAAAESNPNHINNLQVLVSIDCGQTWTSIYSKTGSNLITSSTTMSPFIPFGPSEWRAESIPLSSIASATAATFRFQYTRDTLPSPNNVFIDDINISGTNGVIALDAANGFSVFPNPSNGSMEISFTTSGTHEADVYMTDVTGRIVQTFENGTISEGLHTYKTGAHEAGIYFVVVTIDGRSTTKKVIVE